MDPFIVPYHIVPQRLSFSDLQLLNTNTRLPTLLPGNSILITNTSASNFTLDDSPITQPDFYSTSALAVHSIASLLDYALYGGDGFGSLPKPEVVTPAPLPSAPGPQIIDSSTVAASLCSHFPIDLLLVACALLFTFKIHGNPLSC
ncbi:fasciclin-like arabinogalactan protein 19 [Corylus avellana]|uniref:fasciclin-like arabinogalactan protein 19 n=1 Tax=Corylus avellana TaxID=13451 RepID=UPI00286C115D|nr:fasciclin-like arabinogalactan protein 19 [Corylus avellana]